jgi:two-component system, chemotaxis family, chemotaxis protein CheY
MSDVSGPRILLVDDEAFMRRTARSMLRATGRFIVEEAADGAAALALLAWFLPDLVLCDVGMLPMSGMEFVERLRCHTDHTQRGTRVIMLTADANEATILSAAQLQLSGYLLKPVSPKQLGALVRRALNLQE